MPNKKPDFTNPRQILLEMHKILRDNEPSELSNKELNRWKNNEPKKISLGKRQQVQVKLDEEIIKCLAKLFHVSTNDGANFCSKPGVHKYVGQLFSFIVFHNYHYKLLPFVRTWEKRFDALSHTDDKAALARENYIKLFEALIQFEKRYRKELLLPKTAFNRHLGRYWYLPVYEFNGQETSRLVLPIERMLSRFVSLKGYASRHKMIHDAVDHHQDEDRKEGDYWQIEKSLDRLAKGELLTMLQLSKLRKIRFSKFIIDEHWVDKTDHEKSAHIDRIRQVFHPSPMTDEEFNRFDTSWRKMYNDQNQYFKDSTDGIYELGLILTYLISRMIIDLQQYYPDVGERFARLRS